MLHLSESSSGLLRSQQLSGHGCQGLAGDGPAGPDHQSRHWCVHINGLFMLVMVQAVRIEEVPRPESRQLLLCYDCSRPPERTLDSASRPRERLLS